MKRTSVMWGMFVGGWCGCAAIDAFADGTFGLAWAFAFLALTNLSVALLIERLNVRIEAMRAELLRRGGAA